MSHVVVWVDIPVLDLDRAIVFYSAVLGRPVEKQVGEGFAIGVLPHQGNEVGGCLTAPGNDNAPSATGALVYLGVNGRLEAAVAAALAHGGEVLRAVHSIGSYGRRAVIRDSEGNRIALHAAEA